MAKLIPASWLTARRVRAHGLLLAIGLWSVYAVDLSTPGLRDRAGLIKGTDFLHFYTLGTLALRGRGDLLYNIPAQTDLIRTLLPEAAGTIFVPLYGPQVSLLFAPFARLPYLWALFAWLLLTTFLYAACCYAVWKTCPHLQRYGRTVLILAIAFPGFFHLLAWGQTSALAMLFFTFALLALREQLPLAAGVALGCLVFKPQLALAAAVMFLLTREWKVVLGAIVSAAAQLSIGWPHYGTPVMRDYFRALLHVRAVLPALDPRPYQMQSFRAFWSLLLPWPRIAFGLYIASALVVLTLLVRAWPSRLDWRLRFAALLLASVLVSPHLTVYDLVILAPAFLWLADWAAERKGLAPQAVQLLLYMSYPLFLLAPLARVTHLQLSVLALAALFWISTSSLSASLIPPPAATLNTP